MIYLGADHAGFKLKEKIKDFLKKEGYKFTDCGANKFDPNDDYPQYAFFVADKVSQACLRKQEENSKGILLCRSAAGMVIAANKVNNVRAVNVANVEQAKHSREHNDANIIGLSGDWINEEEAKKIVKTWLETKFSEDKRHVRRLQQITDKEKEGRCCC